MKKAVATLVVSLTVGAVSQAQLQSAYSFGGACPSQGEWTQSVLSHAQVLSSVIEQLKDDANCNALAGAIQDYYTQIEKNPDLNGNEGRSNWSELSGQIFALAGVLNTTPIEKTTLSNALVQKTTEQQVEDTTAGATASGPKMSPLLSMRQRTFNTVNVGLDALGRLSSAIQSSERCLMNNHSAQLGSILSGTVYTLSAFVSGGDNASGAHIAQAIASISQIFKNSNYIHALNDLDQENLDNSIRCLMEVTTDSYCAINDNLQLLQMNVKSLGIKLKDQTKVAPDVDQPKTPIDVQRIVTNPFTGIYVLSQHLPVINTYFQKVLTGVDPSDKYESAKLNDVETARHDFTNDKTSLKGLFAQAVMEINAQPTMEAKRSKLANMVIQLIDQMAPQNEIPGRMSTKDNFFELVAPQNALPFILLGIPLDQAPCRVYDVTLCPDKTAQSIDFGDWITAAASNTTGEYAFMASPDAELQKIQDNLNSILDKAEASFNVYYGTWFLPDKTAIVEQAFSGRPSVYMSLYAVDQYLSDFEKRAKALNASQAPLKMSMDTRRRINTALQALYAYHQSNSIGTNLEDLQGQANNAVLALYQLFNLQQSRTTLLTIRLQQIVTADYDMMLDSGVDFSDYQRKLLYVLGENITNDTANMLGKPWQELQSDLLNASFLAKKNLEAFENVFSDHLMGAIGETRLIAKNLQPSNQNAVMNFDSLGRLNNDSSWLKNDPADNSFMLGLKQQVRNVDPVSGIMRIYNSLWHGDRYRMSHFSFTPGSSSVDSTFGAAAYIAAQMCVQSLAFNNWQQFQDLCRGAILPSVFSDSLIQVKPEDIDALNATYDKIAVMDQQDASKNADDRICAFRNYYRNNYIFQLATDMQGSSGDGSLPAPPTDLALDPADTSVPAPSAN